MSANTSSLQLHSWWSAAIWLAAFQLPLIGFSVSFGTAVISHSTVTVVRIAGSGSGGSVTNRSGHYSDQPYDEVWCIHMHIYVHVQCRYT